MLERERIRKKKILVVVFGCFKIKFEEMKETINSDDALTIENKTLKNRSRRRVGMHCL